MNVTSISHQRYNTLFEQIEARLPACEVSWFAAARKDALADFLRLGLPNRHQEHWRYSASSFALLGQTTYAPQLVDEKSEAFAGKTLFSAIDGYRIVLVSGQFQAAQSTLPKGVTVLPLTQAIQSGEAKVKTKITKAHSLGAEAMERANLAFLQEGVYLDIADQVTVDKPIIIEHVTTTPNESAPVSHHLRHMVWLGKNAQATILESYQGSGSYWLNPLWHIELARDAVLTHHLYQHNSKSGYHSAAYDITLAQHSQMQQYLFTQGGAATRNEIRVDLAGSYADYKLSSLSLTAGKQHHDLYAKVTHSVPASTSKQLVHAIADEHARHTYYGNVTVPKGAQQTNSYQLNKNLLLSDAAQIDSRPELTILADDVKCAHGSATGALDDSALHYLQARGIPETEARALLVEGFATALLEEITQQELQAIYAEAIRHFVTRPKS